MFIKITENNYRLRLFAKFMQTQNRHPTPLDKISLLNCRLLFKSRQTFSCKLNSSRAYSYQSAICRCNFNKDTPTGVLLWVFWIFFFFYRTPVGDCFCQKTLLQFYRLTICCSCACLKKCLHDMRIKKNSSGKIRWSFIKKVEE